MKNVFKKILLRLFSAKSIKEQIVESFLFIILVMVIPPLMVLTLSIHQSNQYDRIISNVNNANKLALIVKTEISDEIWEIVAGNKDFREGNQYHILEDIRNGIDEIQSHTVLEQNLLKLEVVKRALNTLEKYVDMFGIQTSNNASVAENEETLEEIRSVALLTYELFQNFVVAEIESAANTSLSIKHTTQVFALTTVFILCIVTVFALVAQWAVSESIRTPIQSLESFSTQIAAGNLEMRAPSSSVSELEALTSNMNIMAEKIQDLIDTNIKEQKNLQKAQMKTLQAQITPHFLYNTFDTIIWLAESNQNKEVIEITRAFSNFFRISLSKGHEWISVAQEFEHVKNYLTIQKIRYRDILDFDVVFDERMSNKQVLKLVLQPLVENALYHGIKNKRGKGKLLVKGWLENPEEGKGFMHFSVEDNGIGMQPEKLEEIISEMNEKSNIEESKIVYGLYNVNKRLCLYYNLESCLQIASEYKIGTTVSFSVPMERFDEQ